MGKRKNSSSIPRHKRMKRINRLQVASHWLPTYTGKNIVRGYARHFAVDLLCAVKELEMLGNQFKPEYVDQLKRTIAGQIEQKQERKRLKEGQELFATFESDDQFCFIEEYTSGGAPYGLTGEEMDSNEDLDESYLYEGRLENMVRDETEESNIDSDQSGLFLTIKEWEDDISF